MELDSMTVFTMTIEVTLTITVRYALFFKKEVPITFHLDYHQITPQTFQVQIAGVSNPKKVRVQGVLGTYVVEFEAHQSRDGRSNWYHHNWIVQRNETGFLFFSLTGTCLLLP
jgi:hypothetical protein